MTLYTSVCFVFLQLKSKISAAWSFPSLFCWPASCSRQTLLFPFPVVQLVHFWEPDTGRTEITSRALQVKLQHLKPLCFQQAACHAQNVSTVFWKVAKDSHKPKKKKKRWTHRCHFHTLTKQTGSRASDTVIIVRRFGGIRGPFRDQEEGSGWTWSHNVCFQKKRCCRQVVTCLTCYKKIKKDLCKAFNFS